MFFTAACTKVIARQVHVRGPPCLQSFGLSATVARWVHVLNGAGVMFEENPQESGGTRAGASSHRRRVAYRSRYGTSFYSATELTALASQNASRARRWRRRRAEQLRRAAPRPLPPRPPRRFTLSAFRAVRCEAAALIVGRFSTSAPIKK